MKSQSVYKFIAIISLFVFGFIFLFDRYKYYDYEVEGCISKSFLMHSQLIGTYTDSLPHQKGNPYFLRIEVENLTNDISLSKNLEFLSLSTNKSLFIEAIVNTGSSKDGSGSNIFIVEPISLPYDDYLLKGYFMSQHSKTDEFECKIKRKYRKEFRLTFWDNLLSV